NGGHRALLRRLAEGGGEGHPVPPPPAPAGPTPGGLPPRLPAHRPLLLPAQRGAPSAGSFPCTVSSSARPWKRRTTSPRRRSTAGTTITAPPPPPAPRRRRP